MASGFWFSGHNIPITSILKKLSITNQEVFAPKYWLKMYLEMAVSLKSIRQQR